MKPVPLTIGIETPLEPLTPMSHITQSDLIESVAAALQYISYYHPADYIAM